MVSLQQQVDPRVDEQVVLDYRRELFRAAAILVRQQVQASTWKAFWRTCIEGISIDQACTELKMSPSAIYIARSRVVHRLRETIAQWENEDA